ncbi:hypothetical protein EON83_23635 [bacterium]|nr:MAG: hypothetical protein EON83_23635 [bacterium]
MTTTLTSASEFGEMWNDDDVEVSSGIRLCEAPEEVWLEILALHPDLKVDIASNKKLPDRVLELLASDANPRVRFWIAMKRRLPLHLFTALSRDSDISVRQTIAFNKSAPREALEHLSIDENDEIASKAKQRLEEGDWRNYASNT